MAFLDTRSYDGTPISRRTTDGYVNATAMCKANGKRWSDYRESDRADKYLQALASVTGISVNGLIDTKIGGSNGGGTWVHPQVAVDLARWISAPFAVWMDGWFLEAGNPVSAPEDRNSVPALPDGIQKLEWLMGFCDRWDIELDERDRLHIKEHARTLALPPAGGTQSVFNDYPVSRLVQDLFGVVLNNKKYQAIGRALAKRWRLDNDGADPKKHDQYVDGACRSVAHYPRDWAEPTLRRLQEADPEMFRR